MNRYPVSTIQELKTLDEKEVLKGYNAGRSNEPCGDNHSKSYWHGWRNGMTDNGHAMVDAAQSRLAKEVLDLLNVEERV